MDNLLQGIPHVPVHLDDIFYYQGHNSRAPCKPGSYAEDPFRYLAVPAKKQTYLENKIIALGLEPEGDKICLQEVTSPKTLF